MAWDSRARNRSRHEGVPYTVAHRAAELTRWFETQTATLQSAANPLQLSLWRVA